jgi:hypothetical protein
MSGSPRSLLYSGYGVPFPGVKRPGLGVEHTPSSAEVKERVAIRLPPVQDFMYFSGANMSNQRCADEVYFIFVWNSFYGVGGGGGCEKKKG